MSNRQYGVLVNGAGWVSTQHIAAYKANPSTRVVAVADLSPENARQRVSEAGLSDVAIYDSLDQALAHPGIDIVSICTPQHVHCENAIAGAQAGKHLVIEKPVANSPEELARMQAAVREAGVKTVVSFVLRWNPLFCDLKRMIAEGAIGRPYCVETDYLSYNGSWWSGWSEARTRERGVRAIQGNYTDRMSQRGSHARAWR